MILELIDAPLVGAGRTLVNLIDPGKNPRTRFSDTEMRELEQSIRAQGLLQPILLRPVGDRFQIVAGERRFRAFLVVNGTGAEISIPALVKQMDDAEAEMSGLIENVIRAQMSAVDEAESAARVLGYSNGDRDEAARKLGWERKFLDRRIGLMYAIPEVRAALQDNKILLGHAELLAVLRKETQKQVLDGLLAMPDKVTVAQLKDRLERAALSLAKAIFDKADCQGCQYSTCNQRTMFEQSLSDENCTNKPCYEAKTQEEISIRAKALESDYQVVKVIRPGENFTVISLKADGVKGVGVEQAAACRSCKDFGAAVSALPDKLGEVYKGMCFNTPCNTAKVSERIEAERAAERAALKAVQTAKTATPVKPAPSGGADTGITDGADTAKTDLSDSGQAVGDKQKTDKSPAVASSEPSRALTEYREKVWRLVLSRAITRLDADTNRCVLLTLAAFAPRLLSSSDLVKAARSSSIALEGDSSNIGKVFESVLSLDKAHLDKAIALIPAHISDQMEIRSVVSLLKGLDVKLKDHWKVNDEFFTLLTKNEIDATCSEIGIKQAVGAGYSKLIGGKKDELVKAILSIPGFEYKGCIPKQMSW